MPVQHLRIVNHREKRLTQYAVWRGRRRYLRGLRTHLSSSVGSTPQQRVDRHSILRVRTPSPQLWLQGLHASQFPRMTKTWNQYVNLVKLFGKQVNSTYVVHFPYILATPNMMLVVTVRTLEYTYTLPSLVVIWQLCSSRSSPTQHWDWQVLFLHWVRFVQLGPAQRLQLPHAP